MNIKQKSLVVLFCACALGGVHSAPRRGGPGGSSTTFDQKQTGEYNIQLHLKDFQIIAVVGDDSFGSLGDYDYSYDYSDFTVKPSTSTTQKPVSFDTSTSSTTQNGDISIVDFSDVDFTSKPTTKKPLAPATHPYPIVSPSTTKKPTLSTTTTTEKPIPIELAKPPLPSVNGNTPPEQAQTTEAEKVSTASSTSTQAPSSTAKIITSTVSPTTVKTRPSAGASVASTAKPLAAIPGQIPVVVQDFSLHRDEAPLVKDKSTDSVAVATKDKKADAVTSVTIVPLDDTNLGEVAVNEQPTLGEILHYRRCAQGYQRDKRGRCRKVRRPQISMGSMGLTRFASNLAARFRQAESTLVKSDDIPDDILTTNRNRVNAILSAV